MENVYIYKSNGFYFGFIQNGNLFSRDGIYQGWLEANFVWDTSGHYKGTLTEIGGHKYILTKRFTLPPVTRTPRQIHTPVAPPAPPANIPPISLPLEVTDAF